MNIGFDAKRAFLNKSGLGNYSRAVIQSLNEFFPDENLFLFSPAESRINDFNFKNKNIHSVIHKGFFSSAWRSFGMVKEWNKIPLDVFHGLSNELPFGLKKSKTKTIVTIHDLIFKTHPEFYSSIDRTIYNFKTKHSVKNADCVVAVSEQTKSEIQKHYHINAGKIKVIYQSIPSHIHTDVSKEMKEKIREQFSLPQKFLLHVGTIETRKNLLTVLKALALLQSNAPPLVVVGRQTTYMNELKDFIVRNKILVKFISSSSNDELNCIYSLAHSFVYTSVAEGFGIPIIEAASHGIPSIVSKNSCMAEAAGKGGLTVNPLSAEETANAIEKVFTDTQLHQQLSSEARQHSNLFSSKYHAQQLMSVYREIINQ